MTFPDDILKINSFLKSDGVLDRLRLNAFDDEVLLIQIEMDIFECDILLRLLDLRYISLLKTREPPASEENSIVPENNDKSLLLDVKSFQLDKSFWFKELGLEASKWRIRFSEIILFLLWIEWERIRFWDIEIWTLNNKTNIIRFGIMKYFLTFILIISLISKNFSQDKKEEINLKNLGWHGIYTNLNVSVLEMGKQTSIYKDDNKKIGIPKKGEKRIIFFGNSITQNWSVYTDYFKENNYINRGISGQTTYQMLLRFRDDVINLNPSAVIILAGINDLAGNNGPVTKEEVIDNIKSMAEIANANGIKVFLSSILPTYDFIWTPGVYPANDVISINNEIKNYCENNNSTYIDYHTSMKDERDGLKDEFTYWVKELERYDGVHPNKEGYIHMEKIVSKKIKEIL